MRREGQIIERAPGVFTLRVHIGNSRYANATYKGTRKGAQAALRKMLADLDRGALARPSRQTLREFLDEWSIASLRGSVAPRTYEGYRANLRRYILPTLGDKRLTRVRTIDIQRVYQAMLDRGLSATTVRRTHAPLRRALKKAVQWGRLAASPADGVDLPAQRRMEFTPLTVGQAHALLDAVRDSPWRAFYHLMLFTGLRPGEAFGLTWDDIDFMRRVLQVRRAVTYGANRAVVLREPKTNRSRRSIDLTPEVVKVLVEHREGPNPYTDPHGMVFTKANGGLVHPANWSKAEFRRVLGAIGAPKGFRLYDLRHTCATLMLAADVHAKVAAERLGHASVMHTLDTYSHVTPTMQKDASQRLSSLIYETDLKRNRAAVN